MIKNFKLFLVLNKSKAVQTEESALKVGNRSRNHHRDHSKFSKSGSQIIDSRLSHKDIYATNNDLLNAENCLDLDDKNLLFTRNKHSKYLNEETISNHERTHNNVGGSIFPKLK